MNLKKLSILFSFFGILILYTISIFCRPLSIEISEIKDHVGKEVIVKGIVNEILETKYKSQIITIKSNNSSVKVFSEEKTPLEYGDQIKVTGTVQEFEDEFEIIVENIKNIEILKKWNKTIIPLWQLSFNPEKYTGLNVNVEGKIENIANSYFELSDIKFNNTILVSYSNIEKIYLKPGKKVNVKGVFSFDKENFRYMLNLFSKDHGITILG